jgi:hypothetical protein
VKATILSKINSMLFRSSNSLVRSSRNTIVGRCFARREYIFVVSSHLRCQLAASLSVKHKHCRSDVFLILTFRVPQSKRLPVDSTSMGSKKISSEC